MDQLVRDLRYALRTMRRDAGFCSVAVLILGLGIGANTAIFSVVNTVLFRPLPFRSPERLVWIANTGITGLSGATSRVSNYRDLRDANQSFEEMTAYFAFSDYSSYNLTETGEPERLSGYGVAQNFFPMLGVRLALGRNFDAEESKWRGRKAVILTDALWQRRFAGDPKIVGRAITLNGEPYNVIGVTPADFDFPGVFVPGARVDLFVPFPLTDETDRYGNTLAIIGRLRPGKTLSQARAEFALLVDRLHKAHPERGTRWDTRLTALQDQVSGNFRRSLIVLLCAVGAVLLIACANLSNLLLARAASRRKEVSVRVALGASRGRLVRQMLTESVLLSCCGAVIGVAIAAAATRSLANLHAVNVPLLRAVHVDSVALLFAAAAAIATGLIFGIAPALQISSDVHEGLKESARGSSEGKRGGWIRNGLVVSEIALACVLLVGAGLLIRSFVRVMDVDLGFRPGNAAVWAVEIGGRSLNPTQQTDYYKRLEDAILTVPGVESAGATDCLPLGRNRSWGIRAVGVTYEQGQVPLAFPRIVDAGYIAAMKIPLRKGRYFTAHDTAESERAVIINETLAKRLWPDRDAVGQQAQVFGRDPFRVVGVVANVRHSSLEEEGSSEFYLLLGQAGGSSSVDMVVRTKLPPESVASGVRAAIRKVDASLPTAEYRTLDGVVERAVSPRRFIVLLLSGFAGLALVLASLGIYGVVSYSVAQRTQEIGIRMALGASAVNVQLSILRQTLMLALAGALIGLAASVVAAKLMESLLYGVQPGDVLTFSGMLIVLTMVAAVAGYLPAWRASRIDPMSALRSE